MSWLNRNSNFLHKKTPEEVRQLLKEKSSNEILQLLKNEYPNAPRYIDVSEFIHSSKIPGEAIDTSKWAYVRPQYSDNKYTGNWTEIGQGGILNNDDFIVELLLNENPLIKATIPSKGGRRPRRLTRVKSKKRANKRRTRSRK